MGGYEAGMREVRYVPVYAKFWWGNLRESDHLEGPDVDGIIILRLMLSKLNVGHGPNRAGSTYGQMDGTCESGIENSGSI
jgi:hypothetical protein